MTYYCPCCGAQINQFDSECYQCGYKFVAKENNENKDNFKTISRTDGKISGFKVQSRTDENNEFTFTNVYESENGSFKVRK